MENNVIDLRSDTVTKPCKGMRRAMYNAEVGDYFYNEDTLTRELEEYCANYFQTEAALFVITGTMANQIAIRCHTHPGDEIITDNYYHILYYESASTFGLGNVSANILNARDGIITGKDLLGCLSNRHRSNLTPVPKLIWLENTINHYSGRIYPLDIIKEVHDFSINNQLAIHLDGARLLNACKAQSTAADIYSPYVDSIMFSFSKGIGAPAGAVLLGSRGFIEKAKIYQKQYGGGLHQSGILASAALYGMRNNIDCLEVDNENAQLLAKVLSEGQIFTVFPTETNIVMFSVESLKIKAVDFVNILKQYNVLLYPWDRYTVRAVTHKDVSKSSTCRAAQRILRVAHSLYIGT